MSAEVSAATRSGMQAWATRRAPGGDRAWTRTDTQRWLDERADMVCAWLEQKLRVAWPQGRRPRQPGMWMKEHQRAVFDRGDRKLRALSEDERTEAWVIDVLRGDGK